MRRRAGVMATCAVAFCLTLAGCSNGAPEPAPTTSAPDGGTAECTVDLITVLNTQQTLFQAEDTLALARLARMQAVLSLFQALGGSWLPPPPEARKLQ